MSHEPGNGGTAEWYTPPEIFTALGLTFDLDPCAPPLPAASWIPATTRYVRGGENIRPPRLGQAMIQIGVKDGLTDGWFGKVWLNPPYGPQTGRWVGRLADHGDGIALTFTRTDTPWWQAAAARAGAICFPAGRVEFIPGDPEFRRRSRAGAPSCLLAYGDECCEALAAARLGVVVIAELAQLVPGELWSGAGA